MLAIWKWKLSSDSYQLFEQILIFILHYHSFLWYFLRFILSAILSLSGGCLVLVTPVNGPHPNILRFVSPPCFPFCLLPLCHFDRSHFSFLPLLLTYLFRARAHILSQFVARDIRRIHEILQREGTREGVISHVHSPSANVCPIVAVGQKPKNVVQFRRLITHGLIYDV